MMLTLAIAALVVFIAGVVKGYSGFGFSLVVVLSLSLVFPPAWVVVMVLMLEVCGSCSMLPRIWRQVHWRSLLWLMVGVGLGTPLGLYLLNTLPADAMRLGIALISLALVGVMWRGYRLTRMLNAPQITTAGALCGVLNGATAMGGPPAILFYYGGPIGVAASRASLLAFFLCTDLLAVSMAGVHGLITPTVLKMFALSLAPMLLGIALGSLFFRASAADRVRSRVLGLLFLLALTVLVKAAWGYLAA